MTLRYVPKLSRSEMERRLAAGKELLEADPDERGHQARIARKYGVHRSNVSRWARRVQEDGLDALRSTKAKGTPSRLTDDQRERLRTMLLEGARAHGYETDLWTGKRVAQLVRKTFGVRYSEKWLRETWEPARKGRSKADGP